MTNPELSQRRRRDAGLAKVGTWTRRSVAVGIVLSGVLGAGFAYMLPGQAAVVKHSSPAPAPSPADTPTPRAKPSKATQHKHQARRLAPPSAAPRPTQRPTHVTSGGS
jgi:hypothetical protein